jgi:hypothetical protein
MRQRSGVSQSVQHRSAYSVNPQASNQGARHCPIKSDERSNADPISRIHPSGDNVATVVNKTIHVQSCGRNHVDGSSTVPPRIDGAGGVVPS